MSAGQPGAAPPDEAARKRISNELRVSMVVEAGAGTGKTTSLVNRLAGLFAAGARPRDVAAITFTRAAAFELRGKVRRRLEEQHMAAALHDLDDAAIQTIDSFALGLLRERPIEAGLPPVIETLDEIAAGLLFDEKWEAWLSRSLEDAGFTAALESAMRLGMSSPLRKLREIAEAFHGRWEVFGGDKFKAGPVDRQALPYLRREAATLRSLLPECRDHTDKLFVHITETALPAVERLLALSDIADVEAALASATKFKPSLGAKNNWPGRRRDNQPLTDAHAALTGMQQAVDAELAALRQSALNTLLASIASFVAEFAEERRAAGLVGFHDSLVWARDLLKTNAGALAYFRARYKHVLIDEFQDTDPLQVEIARLLTHRDGDAPEQPSPGALFVVGDPKQSIYRFRNADIRAFKTVVSSVPHVDHLTSNFRSHPDILAWVNAVFGPWMEETAGPDQAAYVPLEAGMTWPSGPGASARVRMMGEMMMGQSADVVREAEANALAALALEVGSGALKVSVRNDDGGTSPRNSGFGDLTVLVRSRTGIEFIERAFEDNGVPFALEGQSLVFNTQQVRDLLNCLAAIDDPTDQVAIVAALRSPSFSCDDIALYRWKQAGGRFTYAPGETAPAYAAETASVSQAFDALGRYNRMRSSCSTPELIETFVRDRRLREVALGGRQARARLARISLVVELARQLHEAGQGSLRQFLRWAEDRQGAREGMSESPLEQGTPDAVRVMTIHAAKGLEFPVVALAGLRAPRMHYPTVLFGPSGPDAGNVEVRTGPEEARFQTDGYERLEESERSADDAEIVRLYYVAATRARDYLLVSVFRSDSAREKKAIATKLAGLTEQAEASDPGLCGTWSPVGVQGPVAARPPGAAPAYEPEAWKEDHDGAVAKGRRKAAITASSIKPPGVPDALDKSESPVREDEPWRRGRAASDLGRAVHAVLEEADLSPAAAPGAVTQAQSGRDPRDAALQRLAERQARLHGIAAEHVNGAARFAAVEGADRIYQLAAAVLRSKVMMRAKSAYARGRCWREVPVAAPLPSGDDGHPGQPGDEGVRTRLGTHQGGPAESPILEGVIDLIFEDPSGGLVIVDYKTDGETAVSPGAGDADAPDSLERAAQAHRGQLGAYAVAVEQATGRPVSEAVIVFASRAARGLEAEYHLPDLAGARREAREMVAAAMAREV